ncbi:MAG: EFR1 family ferrodoxin [Prevotella sp.]
MIFCLSCTGNTRWAAELLAAKTGERIYDVLKMEDSETFFTLDKDERIGFMFPVHGWRPPLPLRKFVRRLGFADYGGHYCYAVCTAGDTVGEAMDIFEKDIRQAGLSLDSAFSLIMPESYVGLPFMDVDTPQDERRKIDKAAADMALFADYITERRRGEYHVFKGRWPKTNSRVIGAVFLHCLVTDKPFRVVEDKCLHCGKCASACPVSNVDWQKGQLPQWHHDGKCLSCFACYHHCPVHAIEYGGRTKHKGRYYFGHKE